MIITRAVRALRMRAAALREGPLTTAFWDSLAGTRGLEIGGPSGVFMREGLLPLYALLSEVDCVQWAARTHWHDLGTDADFAPEGVRIGALRIVDDLDLGVLADRTYDVVFCSHVIEHLANPLRALAAWRRVTVGGGHLLVIAPHMAGTFDHRRALTPLEHMVADAEQGVGEDDLTHLPETLALHDHSRDVAQDRERWTAERRDNAATRLLHHHTFTTPSLAALLEHAGVDIVCATARLPHDIYMLGRWREGDLGSGAGSATALRAAVAESPFRLDRHPAGRAR